MSKLIKEIAEKLGASYIYDDWGRINLYADKVKRWPLIAEAVSAEGVINTKFLPVIKTTRRPIVAFLTPCKLDFNGEEVGDQVEAMLALARDFLREYNAAQEVDTLPDTLPYNAVLDFMDANMVGVRVTLDVTDTGRCD